MEDVIANTACLIPMSTIWAFGYDLNEMVVVRVAAWNWVGMSAFSEPNEVGQLARTVPRPPLPPVEGEDTTESELQVDWVAVTDDDTGQSEVLTYTLWCDNGEDSDPSYLLVDALVFTTTITGLTPGSYNFKVRANNVYGEGEWSPTAVIRASYVPDVVVTMTVMLNNDDIGTVFDFMWVAPHSGNEDIDAYEILIYSPTTTTYLEDTDVCNGADEDIVNNRICTIKVNYLMSEFGHAYNTLPKAIARAHNLNGWGGWSAPNVVSEDNDPVVTDEDGTTAHLIEGVPTWAPQPREADGTTAMEIVVEWDPVVLSRVYPEAYLLETGNSWVTSYILYWDAGNDEASWEALAGFDIGTPYMYTDLTKPSITAGTRYAFKTALRNRHGVSMVDEVEVYSEVGYITPSQVPDQQAAVVMSEPVNNKLVRLDWLETPDERGEPVTKYRIYIYSADLSYYAESPYCYGDGRAHPSGDEVFIFRDRYCEIPMTDLYDEDTWGLVQGDLIVATVEAYNLRGWSDPSPFNVDDADSVYVQVAPHALAAPFRDWDGSGELQLTIDWVGYDPADMTEATDDYPALRQDGGRDIISYELAYDEASAGASWITLKGDGDLFPHDLTLEYVLTETAVDILIIPGLYY